MSKNRFFSLPEMVAIFDFFDNNVNDINQRKRFFDKMDAFAQGDGDRLDVFVILAEHAGMSPEDLCRKILG